MSVSSSLVFSAEDLAFVRDCAERLKALYRIEDSSDVVEFLCSAEDTEELCGSEALSRREVLMVVNDESESFVGLYIDPEALRALRADLHSDRMLAERCLVAEGISHLTYLHFRADLDEPVTELELELQAEVDKYATELLCGNGVGAFLERSRWLRSTLFDQGSFLDSAGSERGDRYRLVNRLAASYARSLEERFVALGKLDCFRNELNGFYRLRREDKLRRANQFRSK